MENIPLPDGFELPEGFEVPEGAEVRAMAGTAEDVIRAMINEVGPFTVLNAVIADAAASATMVSVKADCGHTPTEHLDQVFEVLDEAVEHAKSVIRDNYDQAVERARFAHDTYNDIEELDVIDEDTLANLIASFVREDEEG